MFIKSFLFPPILAFNLLADNINHLCSLIHIDSAHLHTSIHHCHLLNRISTPIFDLANQLIDSQLLLVQEIHIHGEVDQGVFELLVELFLALDEL